MKEVCDFFKFCKEYYLATVDDNRPRVRPFGTIMMFQNRLYIQTGKVKDCSRQIAKNPNVELCGLKDGVWLRVSARAFEVDDRDLRIRMLDEYPGLKSMYDPDDGNTQVLELRDAVAVYYSFTQAPRVVKL